MNRIASGITGAAPIWHDIMYQLVKDKPDEKLKQPNDVIQKVVCGTSGLIPPVDGTPNKCPTRFEYFIQGTEPKRVDTTEKVWIDKDTQDVAKAGKTDNVEEKDESIVTDPTGERYCLTCPHPTPSPAPKP
jgi:membrane carboxypeptidase/penicillin-binding protein